MRIFLRRLDLQEDGDSGVARASLLGGLGTLAQSLMRALTNLLVGRLAGVAALGVVASALSLANLLNLLWPASAGSAVAKFIGRARGAGRPEELAAATRHIGRRALAVSVVLGVAALPLWVWLDGGPIVSGLPILALVIGLGGAAFTRGVHFGVGRVSRATFWDVVTGALGLIGTTAVLLAGADGPVVLVPIAAMYVVYTIVCWPRGAEGTLAPALRREIDGFIVLASIGTVASAGFLHASVLAVRAYGGDNVAGQYSAALALATPVALVANSLSMALYPKMARDFGSDSATRVGETADRFTRLLLIVLLAVLGALAIVRGEVVRVVWGRGFDAAAELLPILLCAVFLTSLRVPAVNYLSSGPQRGIVIATALSLTGMLVGGGAWLPLLRALPAGHAIAVGYLAGAAATTVLVMLVVHRRIRARWGRLAVLVGLGAGAVCSVVLLQHHFDTSAATNVVAAALWVMACGLVFVRQFRGSTGEG